jgi:tetratricopeptide (TPR) repeat protein
MGLVGRLGWAEAYAGMAMRAARALNTPWILGTVLVRLGVYRAGIGQWQQGQVETEQAIAHFEAVQDWRGWGDSVNVLHRLLHLHGEYAASGEWSAQLYTRAERNGNAQHVGWGREVAGSNFLRQGRLEEAIAHLEATLGAYGETLTPSDEWSTGALLALAYWRAGQAELARPLAQRALELIKDATPAQFARLSSYFSLAEVYLESWALGAGSEELAERARLAVKLLHRFARYFPIGRPAAWLCQGTLDWLEEKPVSARAAWQKSLAFAEKLDMPYEAGRAHYQLGRHLPAGDPARDEHVECARALLRQVGARYELEQLAGGDEGRTTADG